MKLTLTLAGGILCVLNLLWYAWRTYQKKIPAQNPASWLMWVGLDAILLGSTIQAKQPIWLPLSYTIGAIAVTAVLFARSTWVWTWKEWLCFAGAVLAAYFWIKLGALAGIIAGLVAMSFAGTPIMIDMIRNPIRSTFPVWCVTAIACMLTLMGSDWTWTGTLTAVGGISYNGIMSLIVLRRN